jgi:hypothetical protein
MTLNHLDPQAFFLRYLRHNYGAGTVTSIAQITLPNDADFVRKLATICSREALVAMRAGRHVDGRRLDVLADQLRSASSRGS